MHAPASKSASTDSTPSTDSAPSDDSDLPRTPSDEQPPFTFPSEASPWLAVASGRPSPVENFKRQHSTKSSDNPYFASPPTTPSEEPSLVPPLLRQRREDVILMSKTLHATDVQFSREGEWTGSITNTIPRSKTIYHWSVGETCSTPCASVRFFVTIKVSSDQHLCCLFG